MELSVGEHQYAQTPLLFSRSTQSSVAAACLTASLESLTQALATAGPSAGRLVNTRDERGITPLMLAACHEDEGCSVSLCKLLLEHGATPNLPDVIRRTALHWAAGVARDSVKAAGAVSTANGHSGHHTTASTYIPSPVTALLLQHGADPNMVDHDGETALHRASRYGCTGAIAALLQGVQRTSNRAAGSGSPSPAPIVRADPRILNHALLSPLDVAGYRYVRGGAGSFAGPQAGSSGTAGGAVGGAGAVPAPDGSFQYVMTLVPSARSFSTAALTTIDPSLRVLVLHHPDCLLHENGAEAHQEAPQRVQAILEQIGRDFSVDGEGAQGGSVTGTAGPTPPAATSSARAPVATQPPTSSSTVGTGAPAPAGTEVVVRSDVPLATGEQITRAHSRAYWGMLKVMEAVVTARHLDSALPMTPMVQRSLRQVPAALVKQGANDTGFGPGTLQAARRAAGAVCKAVENVINGRSRHALCVVRPPGHHAGVSGLPSRELYGDSAESCGFCILNNVAIGALHAMEYSGPVAGGAGAAAGSSAVTTTTPAAPARPVRRVAIVDIDAHHGNGTEEIVRQWARDHRPGTPGNPDGSRSLFFFSIHLYDVERVPEGATAGANTTGNGVGHPVINGAGGPASGGPGAVANSGPHSSGTDSSPDRHVADSTHAAVPAPSNDHGASATSGQPATRHSSRKPRAKSTDHGDDGEAGAGAGAAGIGATGNAGRATRGTRSKAGQSAAKHGREAGGHDDAHPYVDGLGDGTAAGAGRPTKRLRFTGVPGSGHRGDRHAGDTVGHHWTSETRPLPSPVVLPTVGVKVTGVVVSTCVRGGGQRHEGARLPSSTGVSMTAGPAAALSTALPPLSLPILAHLLQPPPNVVASTAIGVHGGAGVANGDAAAGGSIGLVPAPVMTVAFAPYHQAGLQASSTARPSLVPAPAPVSHYDQHMHGSSDGDHHDHDHHHDEASDGSSTGRSEATGEHHGDGRASAVDSLRSNRPPTDRSTTGSDSQGGDDEDDGTDGGSRPPSAGTSIHTDALIEPPQPSATPRAHPLVVQVSVAATAPDVVDSWRLEAPLLDIATNGATQGQGQSSSADASTSMPVLDLPASAAGEEDTTGREQFHLTLTAGGIGLTPRRAPTFGPGGLTTTGGGLASGPGPLGSPTGFGGPSVGPLIPALVRAASNRQMGQMLARQASRDYSHDHGSHEHGHEHHSQHHGHHHHHDHHRGNTAVGASMIVAHPPAVAAGGAATVSGNASGSPTDQDVAMTSQPPSVGSSGVGEHAHLRPPRIPLKRQLSDASTGPTGGIGDGYVPAAGAAGVVVGQGHAAPTAPSLPAPGPLHTSAPVPFLARASSFSSTEVMGSLGARWHEAMSPGAAVTAIVTRHMGGAATRGGAQGPGPSSALPLPSPNPGGLADLPTPMGFGPLGMAQLLGGAGAKGSGAAANTVQQQASADVPMQGEGPSSSTSAGSALSGTSAASCASGGADANAAGSSSGTRGSRKRKSAWNEPGAQQETKDGAQAGTHASGGGQDQHHGAAAGASEPQTVSAAPATAAPSTESTSSTSSSSSSLPPGSILWQFYPGTGEADLLEANVINCPVAPLWRDGVGGGGGNGHHGHKGKDGRKGGDKKGGPGASSSASGRPATGWPAVRQLISDRLIPALRAFGPDLILVSAGFDGGKDDFGNARNDKPYKNGPPQGLNLRPEDFHWITTRLLEVARVCCPGRVVAVLEGGYGRLRWRKVDKGVAAAVAGAAGAAGKAKDGAAAASIAAAAAAGAGAGAGGVGASAPAPPTAATASGAGAVPVPQADGVSSGATDAALQASPDRASAATGTAPGSAARRSGTRGGTSTRKAPQSQAQAQVSEASAAGGAEAASDVAAAPPQALTIDLSAPPMPVPVSGSSSSSGTDGAGAAVTAAVDGSHGGHHGGEAPAPVGPSKPTPPHPGQVFYTPYLDRDNLARNCSALLRALVDDGATVLQQSSHQQA